MERVGEAEIPGQWGGFGASPLKTRDFALAWNARTGSSTLFSGFAE
jgi:hypothetical protein